MTKKIIFVHAPRIEYEQNYGVTLVPLWAFALAAYIPDDWDVEVYNTQIDGPANLVGSADVYALSGMNYDIRSVKEAREKIKTNHPDATFIVGGPMVWSMEQEGKLSLLEEFDHLFILDGEETLPKFLSDFNSRNTEETPKIIRSNRFAVSQSVPIRFDLLAPTARKYYGGMIEVSRGCPFLCEFCDIRVLPGNNRSNNKSPEVIVEELDRYYKLGINQIQFACDNFIGDIQWARACVDAIIEWRERTGAKISIFTWLTINLHKMPELMEKMRIAGFSIINIGIESVNRNSLLETAKVQNTANEIHEAVSIIQSYGFVIIPGFIFGFDSDDEEVFNDTLKFKIETGLMGGEPAFLQALAGTPLFKRLERSGRVIPADEQAAIVRKGNIGVETYIETNVRYLLDSNFLAEGFMEFIRTYISADFQFARFKRHMEILETYGNYIEPPDSGGYASFWEYLKYQVTDFSNFRMLLN
ncbi:MAG: radical SAM protein, partial [Planctomycetaceae bacterium]